MKIKVTIPGARPNASLAEWTGKESPAEFFVNTEVKNPDIWMVFDDGVEGDTALIDRRNIFFMTAEICYPIGRFDEPKGKKYLSQFSKLFTMHDILDERKVHVRPFTNWMINANHGFSSFEQNGRDKDYFLNLRQVEKTYDLSVICSTKAFTPEHYLRLKFVSKLKEDLGNRLHWFGNGINALADKWPGIAPYRYHLAIENRFGYDIISEKLYDSFLGLSMPIYYGAPNVDHYYSEWSMQVINIHDYKRSKRLILDLIESDVAERSYSDLMRAKNQAADRDNWTTRMAEIAKNYGVANEHREEVYLYAY